MKTPPEKFTITITENDRLMAGPFIGSGPCLIETALKRRGYSQVMEMVSEARVNGSLFDHDWCGHQALCVKDDAIRAPYYYSMVVGKKITFVRK